MTEREILFKKLSTYAFACLELNLFLDTHPGDLSMAKKLAEYTQKYEALKNEFEKLYGPITWDSESKNRWAWIQGPWPWEKEGD